VSSANAQDPPVFDPNQTVQDGDVVDYFAYGFPGSTLIMEIYDAHDNWLVSHTMDEQTETSYTFNTLTYHKFTFQKTWDVGGKYVIKIKEQTNPGACESYGDNVNVSVEGQQLWFKADAGVSLSGTNVTLWTDQSGKGITAAPVASNNQPVLQGNALNYNPILSFDGSDDFMNLSNLDGLGYGKSKRTTFVVAKDDGTSTGNWRFAFSYGTPSEFQAWCVGRNLPSGKGIVLGSWQHDIIEDNWDSNNHILTGDFDGSQMELYKNGNSIGTLSTNVNTTKLKGTIGRQINDSEYWSGSIAEIIHYTGQLSDDKRSELETYLAIKYGVVLNHNYTKGSIELYSVVSHSNDVFGIGRDSEFNLDQKISSSQNSDATESSNIVISTSNDLTSSNQTGRTSLTNGQYLIIGHDNLTTTAWQSDESYQRVERLWKVQNTNDVGEIYFQINLKDYPTATNGGYLLAVDDDQDLSNGTSQEIALTKNGDLYSTSVDFVDGVSYFTIIEHVGPTADAGVAVSIGACATSTTTLTGSGTGKTVTYSWLPVEGLSDASIASPVANPNTTTTYTLTVEDVYGYTASDQVTVTVDAAPTADAGIDETIGLCGTANLNGSGTGNTLTYSWSPNTNLSDASIPNPDANPNTTTTYTLTVTDKYNCNASDEVTITVSPALTISLAETNPILCNGDNADVTITAGGGDGTYTYSQDGSTYGASNVFSLAVGTHTLYVKDGNNCVTNSDITIIEPSALTVTADITNVDCDGDNTGIVDLTVSGGELGALSFDGTDEGIHLASSMNNLDGFTVEGWVKFNSSNSYSSNGYSLFGQNNLVEFSINSSGFYAWVNSNAGQFSFQHPFDNPTLNNDQWHHIALTGSKSELVLYINGTEVKSHGLSLSASDDFRSGLPVDTPSVGTGVANGGTDKPFDGEISSVRFWTVARTFEEISSGMSERMTGMETGLFAAYRLDEGTGTSISGVGSNASDVTINSALSWQTNEPIYIYEWTKQEDASFTASTQDLIDVSEGNYDVTIRTPNGCSISASYKVDTDDDREDPSASNPNPINVKCIGEIPTPDITVVTDAVDNCTSTPSIAWVSDSNNGGDGTTASPYVVTRTYSVTDDASNSINVVQTITVVDNIPPSASNPTEVDVQCINNIPATDISVVTDAADNCTTTPTVAWVSDTNNGGDGTTASPYVVSRTYSVTDDAGNSINVVQTITVVDNTPPSASNPAAVNIQCIEDIPTSDISVVTDAVDNCTTTPTIAWASDSNNGGLGTTASPYVLNRTYSVTDDAGNRTDVVQIITVIDDEAPSLANLTSLSITVCPDDGTEGDSPQTAKVYDLSLNEAMYSDNCTSKEDIEIQYQIVHVTGGNVNLVNYGTDTDGDPSGYAFPEGVSEVSFKVIDEAGNERSGEFTVTVSHKPNPSNINF